jgi:hypothetical protein
MSIDEAIKAHVSWKMKLSNYLANPDRSLNAADISVDNRCDLGRWIHGTGSGYAALPEFVALKQKHAHFHRTAGSIVSRADRGEKVSKEVVFGSGSDFAKASSDVVSALMNIKLKIVAT